MFSSRPKGQVISSSPPGQADELVDGRRPRPWRRSRPRRGRPCRRPPRTAAARGSRRGCPRCPCACGPRRADGLVGDLHAGRAQRAAPMPASSAASRLRAGVRAGRRAPRRRLSDRAFCAAQLRGPGAASDCLASASEGPGRSGSRASWVSALAGRWTAFAGWRRAPSAGLGERAAEGQLVGGLARGVVHRGAQELDRLVVACPPRAPPASRS